jgi:NADPH:quinone reductase-like Zn-dependent oxidoreductase/malonyl CoA-acyl carrier protein transacylase/acyl carrier protein
MYNIEDNTQSTSSDNLNQALCRSLQLIPIGAPTQERAIDIVRSIDDIFLEDISDDEYHALIEAAWRSALGPSRWIIAGRDIKEMRQSLGDFVLKGQCAAAGTRNNTSRRVTFVFSGMGPQWGGMGRELASNLPRFAHHIHTIDALFVKHYKTSVWNDLYKHKDAKQLPTALAQTGNFLLQAALYNLLVDEDIVPDAIFGHSAGEVAAAYAAGVYTLEDAVRVAATRGKLQATLAGRGSMLAAGLSRQEAIKILADYPGISIAAINDDIGITLSGDTEAIQKLDQQLQKKQVFSKLLRVEVPYHSPVMDEITRPITSELSFLRPSQSSVKLYSTVTGTQTDGPEWDAGYWAYNIRQPVLFSDTMKLALSEGYNCFIEIAPHPVLSQNMSSLSADYPSAAIHHLLSRKENEYDTFVTRISELAIDGIGRPPKRASAPLLRPVPEPQKLWDEDPGVEATRRGDLAVAELPLLGRKVSSKTQSFDVEISTVDYPWMADHTVQDLGAIVPATLWAELIAMAVSEGEQKSVRLTDLRIVQSLPVSDNPTIISTKVEGSVAKCLSRPLGKSDSWTLHALASIASVSEQTLDSESSLSQLHIESESTTFQLPVAGTRVEPETLYSAFKVKGLTYTGFFKNITNVIVGEGDEAWAIIDGMEPYTVGLHSPWVLDAGLQLLIAAAKDWGEKMYLPFRISKVNLYRTITDAGKYKAHACISVRTDSELIGSVRFYDSTGQLLAELEEIACLRNFSDDAERLNYVDRNTYTLRNLIPEEIAERFSEDNEDDLELVETTEEVELLNNNTDALEEYWIIDRQSSSEPSSLPFDRPYYELDSIEEDSKAHLLWILPNRDLKSDVLATAKLIQSVGKLGIRTLTLTLIAKRGQEWLSGMRRSAANSYGLSIRAIFLDDDTSPEMLEAVVDLTSEHEIVFEADEPLLRRLEKVTSEHLRISRPHNDIQVDSLPTTTLSFEFARGQFNKLVALKEPLPNLGEGEVCIEVDATSLTWKDIGKVLGTIGTNVVNTFAGYHLGSGAAGVVIATGTGAPVSVGDRVFGPIQRSYRKHIVFNALEASRIRRIPDGVDNTTMTSHTVPWITTFTVFENAKPKPGDKVFIQSGAGGVGSVLCLYARRLGAQVITSVGTDKKIAEIKKVVPDIEVIVARGEAIPDALIDAGHNGFDWIVATVSGNARTSLMSQLNMLGHYIDIGKPGSVDESLLSSTFEGNKHYFVMDIDQLFARKEGWLESQIDRVLEIIADPTNHVPVTCFPISQMPDAVNAMGRGETTGCVAITIPHAYFPPAINASYHPMNPDGVYLITGGYGAVGLICAQWLSSRGARHIVLSGSSGKPNKESQATIDMLRACGMDVRVAKTDSTDPQSVMDLVRQTNDDGRIILGVIHAAGVVADGQFEEIDARRVASSFGPKLEGAYHLVEALETANALDGLQFLIFTSSVSSVIGITIQGTYAAANAGLDGIAEELRVRGVNATAMQLGPIDAGGMAADDMIHRYLSTIGLGYVSPRRLFSILDLAVVANVPHFVTEEIDWARNGRAETANTSSSLLRHIVQPAMSGNSQADLEYLLALDHDSRTEVLKTTLLEIINSALGVEEGYLNGDSNFSSMGVDSLAIMEVQAGINDTLQMDLPLTRMFNQDGTINQLAAQLSEYLEEDRNMLEVSA